MSKKDSEKKFSFMNFRATFDEFLFIYLFVSTNKLDW